MRKILILTILILISFGLVSLSRNTTDLQILMLDVGQGDAFLIISPDNKKLLIDTGKDTSALNKLREELSFFDTHIDYVVITHPDSDHAGGYKFIQDYYTIGTKIENATENSDFVLGCCVTVDFIWKKTGYNSKDTNENSAAFFIKYNEFIGFFAGDLPSEQENWIAKNYSQDISLLKVSHHGSSTSSDDYMLSIFRPEIALISAGKNNSYNHPTKKTLENLMGVGAKIYRTDELGTVHLSTDGFQIILL